MQLRKGETPKREFMRGATALDCIDVAVRIGDAKREFATRDKFDGRDVFVQLFLSSNEFFDKM